MDPNGWSSWTVVRARHSDGSLRSGFIGLVALVAVVSSPRTAGAQADPPAIQIVRVPDGGLQPQVAVDAAGTLHLLWFHGDPLAGDLFYARSSDGGASFGPPLRVNQADEGAVAIGNVRGGHLALGRAGRVHVAWMGSSKAAARTPEKKAPMLYTRSNAAGTAFEAERNVLRAHPGLDGGGSVAADDTGHVFVAWHAPDPLQGESEAERAVWLTASTDDGATFDEERRAWNEPTGACGCCGMRAACCGSTLTILYRTAKEEVHRDLYALVSTDSGRSFRGMCLDDWRIAQCVMSTTALATDPGFEHQNRAPLAAWEDEGEVHAATLALDPLARAISFTPPAAVAVAVAKGDRAPRRADRKHPAIAADAQGRVLLAWTEGMGWERGGTLVWQLFAADGTPVAGACGRRDGVPTWSLVAVAARVQDGFTILY